MREVDGKTVAVHDYGHKRRRDQEILDERLRNACMYRIVTPANRLEKLRGDRAGQYSVRINDQWRLCFRWGSGDAFDVEITDYH